MEEINIETFSNKKLIKLFHENLVILDTIQTNMLIINNVLSKRGYRIVDRRLGQIFN